MKSYNVVEAEGKFFCVEYEPNGFFTHETNRWPFQTREFADACVKLFNKFEWDAQPKVDYSKLTISGSDITTNQTAYVFNTYKPGNWKCYMFGSDENGMTYIPNERNVPNWFWRQMQYLCFGNKWVKMK